MADLLLYFFIMLAGLLSFLSPCVLPLVPPYLCYLGGVTFDELSGESRKLPPHVHARIILAAVFFVLGFTTIFTALGAGASAFGQLLLGWKILLTRIAGGVIILFGLHFLGILRIGLLYRDTRFQTNSTNVSVIGAFVMGLAFAFGWTPCIGRSSRLLCLLRLTQARLARVFPCCLYIRLGLAYPSCWRRC